MFRRQIALTISLLLVVTAVALLWMMPTSVEEHQALAELIGSAAEVKEDSRSLSQHRVGLRREFVEGVGQRKVLFAVEADSSFDYDTKQLVESYRAPTGYSVQPVPTNESEQIVVRFGADEARFSHHDKRLDGKVVWLARYQVPIEVSPEDCSHEQPMIDATAARASAHWDEGYSAEADDVQGQFRDKNASFSCRKLVYGGETITLQEEVCITTPQISLKAERCDLQQGSTGPSIRTAVLQGNVEVSIADGSLLLCDRATIDPVHGVALFSMDSSRKVCWKKDDLQLLAKRLQMHFAPVQFDARATEIKPETIQASEEVELLQAQFRVEADELNYSLVTGLCTLKNTKAFNQGLGELRNDQVIMVYLDPSQAKPVVSRMTLDGHTQCAVVMHGSDKRTLTTYGPVVIDHLAGTATFEKPADTAPEPQIVMTSSNGELHSDCLTIGYQSVENAAPTVTLVEAYGNVYLRGSVNRVPDSSSTQFALCDKLAYWPAEQRTVLSSKPGRVAIMDKSNGLAVSAPAVELRRDPNTHKETVKGLGDVRFSLLDREYQRLKERFSRDLIEIPQKKR